MRGKPPGPRPKRSHPWPSKPEPQYRMPILGWSRTAKDLGDAVPESKDDSEALLQLRRRGGVCGRADSAGAVRTPRRGGPRRGGLRGRGGLRRRLRLCRRLLRLRLFRWRLWLLVLARRRLRLRLRLFFSRLRLRLVEVLELLLAFLDFFDFFAI